MRILGPGLLYFTIKAYLSGRLQEGKKKLVWRPYLVYFRRNRIKRMLSMRLVLKWPITRDTSTSIEEKTIPGSQHRYLPIWTRSRWENCLAKSSNDIQNSPSLRTRTDSSSWIKSHIFKSKIYYIFSTFTIMRSLRYTHGFSSEKSLSARVPVRGLNPKPVHTLRENHLATPHPIVISCVLTKKIGPILIWLLVLIFILNNEKKSYARK